MRELSADDVALIKQTCAKDANEDEFKLFMLIAKKSRLDPFLKQIYCVIFQGERTGRQMVIITGIGGFRMMAARDHKDYGGTSDAKYVWPADGAKTPAKRRIPEEATVTAYRKGGQAGSATAFWEEFAPPDLTHKRADFWNRMPKHMLAKCAEALALRKMFPGLNNIFTEEEMSARLQDLTEGGREISVEGVAPSGRITNQRENEIATGRRAAQKVLDEKLAHGHEPGTERARQAEASLKRVEDEDARLAAAKNVTPKPQTTTQAEKPSQAAPEEPVWPKRDSGKPEARPDTKPASRGEEDGAKRTPPAATLVSGTLSRSVGSLTKNNAPVLNLKVGNVWYPCYKNTLHNFIAKGDGQVIEFYIDAHKSVIGLKRIGRQQFEDGVTPVVQNSDREAGQRTLY